MLLFILIVFGIIFAIAGIGYYRFCRDTAESLLNMMSDDEKIKKEGGDNWPSGEMSPEDIIVGRRLSNREREERVREKERSGTKEFHSCFRTRV
jgi:hypothetical protein